MGKRYLMLMMIQVFILMNVQSQTKVLPNNFVPPLEIPMFLSGNFAELRPNHFHTGIDIKTKGKVGEKVNSIEDGYVARVYVSPYGYGKALYIKHHNGYTSVYGHLDSFSEKIDVKVKSIQYQNEQFTLDHQFDADELPIKRGEIIALSGNSGSSGGPHLHFEVRKSASEKPVNPLLFGFDIKDEVRPQISDIKLLNVNGSINGSTDDAIYSTVFYGEKFHLKSNPNIRAWGEIGLGFQSFDYLSGDWSKCGIREAELFVDGKSYAIYQSDTLSFDELRFINASTDYPEKLRTGRWFLKLFKSEPNNQLSNVRPFINRGVININEERNYELKLMVLDSYNNQSELNFSIRGEKSVIAPKKHDLDANPFFWNQENVFAKDNFRISISPKVLYDDASFLFREENSDFLLSKVYEFGDVYTPLHGYASIKIKAPRELANVEKLYIVRLSDKNNTIEALNSSLKDGWIGAYSKYLGRFALLKDTIRPEVKPLQNISEKKISHLKSISFKISDDESGIKKYRAYIDDKWALFEFDGKKNRISYEFDDQRISKNQHHTLRIELTDNSGNINIYKTRFYR